MNRSPLSIYVHIPICLSKCPYCDFNSYATDALMRSLKNSTCDTISEFERVYTDALIAEINLYCSHPVSKEQNATDKDVTSIFFGGGTPSYFSSNSICKILSAINQKFHLAPNAEITLEANPGTLREALGFEKLREYKQAGINRLSVGIQSFSETKLKRLGRIHSKVDSLKALSSARDAGFSNISVDLIFGTADEAISDWKLELEAACNLRPKHISAYGLTIEPGTEFFQQKKRGTNVAVNDWVSAQMYELTQSVLTKEGYKQYEISNYALPGYESKHNLAYWTGQNYLGIGAGAHSYTRAPCSDDHRNSRDKQDAHWGQRWSNILAPPRYIQSYIQNLQNTETFIHKHEFINKTQAKIEFFLLGLRTNKGASIERYERLFKSSLREDYDSILNELNNKQLICIANDTISLTTKGFLFSDSVFEAFADGA